jgi:hypothetical protein
VELLQHQPSDGWTVSVPLLILASANIDIDQLQEDLFGLFSSRPTTGGVAPTPAIGEEQLKA